MTTTTGTRAMYETLSKALSRYGTEDEFSQRMGYSFMIGVYLGINAIRDAYILVEGPDCGYMKTQYVQGNHDWMSTLTSVSGHHRVANTALHPSMMVDSREAPLRQLLERIAREESTEAVFLSSLPMAFITGADYERLCRSVHDETGTEVIYVKGLSLQGDWLDGYAEVLTSLARQLPLPEVPTSPDKVALVGYLFDRNEDDHTANIRILREMLGALGLEVSAIWLEGGGYQDLKGVAEAGTIISMPYGRRAAKLLARRTGADLIAPPYPFGITKTEAWLRDIAAHFGRQTEAEAYIDRALSRIIPKLEWLAPFQFQHVTAGYVGDPHLYPGFVDTMELLGASPRFGIITNMAKHCRELGSMVQDHELLLYPRLKRFAQHLVDHYLAGSAELIVTNNSGMNVPLAGSAMVEFGFPSVYTHALYDRPFLGFDGSMAFVDSLANVLRHGELDHARQRALEEGLG